MKQIRSFRLSLNALLTHKLRTFLALTGPAIGVAAVIIMVAVGQGTQQKVLERIRGMGTNLLTIKAGQVKKLVGRQRQYGNATTLTLRDARAIAETFDFALNVAPIQERTLRTKYGNISTMPQVFGATPELEAARNYRLAAGRFFDDAENRASLRVAVIGSQVRDSLFKDVAPLGELIRIGGVPFEVIGVLAPVGLGAAGGNEDNRIIIPLRTGLRRVFNLTHLSHIYVQVREQSAMKPAQEALRLFLRKRHRLDRWKKKDDFTIHNQVTAVEMERESGEWFTFLIAGIAGIALLVGGIGILAIMLLSVRERRGEIGLRRAVGARARDVLVQFVLEALVLGFAGGFVGLLVGVLGAGLVGFFTLLPFVFPLKTAGGALVFSVVMGLIFGVYPAWKASQLEPVTALGKD